MSDPHKQHQKRGARRDSAFGDNESELHSFQGWLEAKRYVVQEVIGKGSYGVVYKALDRLTNEHVAIKRIQNVFDSVADAVRVLREIKLLRRLKHWDVVEMRHIMLPPDPRCFKDIYLVFELLETDLHTAIASNNDLSSEHHRIFLYQLLRGLNFLHASGVLHRDLKPRNILANSNCKLKICDFGLARPSVVEPSETPVLWTDYVATRWYRAPELCGSFYGKYTQAVDVWSVGCIFAELLSGEPLFPGRDAITQLRLITNLLGTPTRSAIDRVANPDARRFLSKLPSLEAMPFAVQFPTADPLARDLLRKLLAFDPLERPTAAEALSHPYFVGLPSPAAAGGPGGPVDVGLAEFAILDSLTLNEAEVRQLIFKEIVQYHPNHVAASSSRRLSSQKLLPPRRPRFSDDTVVTHDDEGGSEAGCSGLGSGGWAAGFSGELGGPCLAVDEDTVVIETTLVRASSSHSAGKKCDGRTGHVTATAAVSGASAGATSAGTTPISPPTSPTALGCRCCVQ